jgi:NADP-dependent 3-hydroxy acid dehydrogenase YdfG
MRAGDAHFHRCRSVTGRPGLASVKVLLTSVTSGLGLNAAHWLLEKCHELHATGRDCQVGWVLHELGAEFTSRDLTRATLEQCQQLMSGCNA